MTRDQSLIERLTEAADHLDEIRQHEVTPAIREAVDRLAQPPEEFGLKWAEGLIQQLPEHHNGRNSWLLNYGQSEEAVIMREERRERDEANGQFGVGA